MKTKSIVLIAALLLGAQPVVPAEVATTRSAAVPADANGQWITLGTRGGPLASATRSQPANLLVYGGRRYLVDVGDGAAGQLAKAGVTTAALDGVFISHLHFDHTAGLAGILGLRFQTNAANAFTIFGPPGTRELVDGLFRSMGPGVTANYGVPGAPAVDPRAGVEVVELRDRMTRQVGGMAVSVRSNSHYSFPPGGEMADRFQSLSYRFDLAGRSIVYTGDTGPSAAVEELAKDADLLVAEMMDVEGTVAMVRRLNPGMPAPQGAAMETHLRQHHLLPRDVGDLAARAGVKSVVVTHFVGSEEPDPAFRGYLEAIATRFRGPVVIARDLQTF